MANPILHVENYGKIKKAEIQLADLVLFVGDNNSGKSYLTSLIWGFYNIGAERLFSDVGKLNSEAEKELYQWLEEQLKAAEREDETESIKSVVPLVITVINECLERKKGEFVKWIFNSDKVTIGKLAIKYELSEEIFCSIKREDDSIKVAIGKKSFQITSEIVYLEKKKMYFNVLVKWLLATVLHIPYISDRESADIYIPAARTGFMLTKDIISRVGRQRTFNMVSEMDEEIEITPFTKPINQFVDEICGLSVESEKEDCKKELAEIIECEMICGSVQISSLPSKEISYLPEGLTESKPLRVSSAVVTELSPLILLFKHRPGINSLFYEEPEMGLHLQLQQKMGKILVEAVNSGINIVSTTHSDIILQHVNNMIKLKKHDKCEEICKSFGYTEKDLLEGKQVKVYQFINEDSHNVSVEELTCTENGFEIPTFNNALDKIMQENYELQE